MPQGQHCPEFLWTRGISDRLDTKGHTDAPVFCSAVPRSIGGTGNYQNALPRQPLAVFGNILGRIIGRSDLPVGPMGTILACHLAAVRTLHATSKARLAALTPHPDPGVERLTQESDATFEPGVERRPTQRRIFDLAIGTPPRKVWRSGSNSPQK